MGKYVLAIDQGTTGTTAMIFDRAADVVSRAYSEFSQHYPRPGWVEHDPEEIWSVTEKVIHQACRKKRIPFSALAAIGITNQRETTVIWNRKTGRPVHRAIVWQDRRTAPLCESLRARGLLDTFRYKTGLVLDPYFSATKIAWLLEHVKGAGRQAERGDLCFGTIDSWLLWKLSGGEVHATDYTNASRTLLFNIHTLTWDEELLSLLHIPPSLLPRVFPSSGPIAETHPGVLGGSLSGRVRIPVAGIAGDQQAALFGQACFQPGMVKNTYGTGCFVLMHTGERPVLSERGLLSTVACSAGGRPACALEGSIFIAGAAIQWLRDGLGFIAKAGASERFARKVSSTLGVYLVPAFAGLGAPYWDAEARGAILGLTRGTTKAHLIRAALEAIAYQTRDVVETMTAETGRALTGLRVDGGAATNDFLMQFQADILGVPVDRPKIVETTAMGAAFLAGLGVGFWPSLKELEKVRKTERFFRPKMRSSVREELYQGWKKAVERVRTKNKSLRLPGLSGK